MIWKMWHHEEGKSNLEKLMNHFNINGIGIWSVQGFTRIMKAAITNWDLRIAITKKLIKTMHFIFVEGLSYKGATILSIKEYRDLKDNGLEERAKEFLEKKLYKLIGPHKLIKAY